MENRTILAVDDTVENLDILTELLEDYDVIDAISGEEALEILKEEKVDLVLLDVMMPDMDGFEVCRRIRENPETKDIPIIFITAMTDEESIVKAYDMGGNDYVTKPFKKKELLAKIRREFKLQELQRELKLMALTDPLTKLYNRRYFMDISKHIVHGAVREKQPLSILLMDIDHFKRINDTYGHDVGDKVLISFANALTGLSRRSDVVCRWGGEEFVALLPNTETQTAKSVAEKIRGAVERLRVETDSGTVRFTLSIGVSGIDIDKEKSVEPALKRADEALYEAKESGRNCVVVKDF